ncbi:MAG: ATP-binding cassette domain-containing protein, partial [Chloroflexota bacterium]
MSEQPTVIQAANLNKIYNPNTEEAVIALQDINLDVQSGEFISLIGPSGCGKSTLLRLIANLIDPTSGDLTV